MLIIRRPHVAKFMFIWAARRKSFPGTRRGDGGPVRPGSRSKPQGSGGPAASPGSAQQNQGLILVPDVHLHEPADPAELLGATRSCRTTTLEQV